MPANKKILKARATCTQEIKKSRFIATAIPVTTPEEALDALAEISIANATHNCWAYRCGEVYRFSDDGEPGGTAGRPIFRVLEGENIDGILVVVTRYYGGIKLGRGGLMRAYGGAAQECLRTAELEEVVETTELVVRCPFDIIGSVYRALEGAPVVSREERYEPDGLALHLEVVADAAERLAADIIEATAGKASVGPGSE